eukprot:550680-Amphidinium_carterae.1
MATPVLLRDFCSDLCVCVCSSYDKSSLAYCLVSPASESTACAPPRNRNHEAGPQYLADSGNRRVERHHRQPCSLSACNDCNPG